MVIILGGESTDDITVPGEQIKNSGVSKIIVVGIGQVISEDLKTTASSPENALISSAFTQLSQRVPDVIALINSGIAKINNTSHLLYMIKHSCKTPYFL